MAGSFEVKDRSTDREWRGYCAACDSSTTFVKLGEWLRDQLICDLCGSIPRFRALMYVLSLVRPTWPLERIWELAPAGPASQRLAAACQNYTASQYWPDVPPGQSRDGIRCEDIESPTFADESFDVVVACDVLEHVFDIDRALTSVQRVLTDTGIFLWTVPQRHDLPTTTPRVRRGDRSVEYLLPPEYHGDPVNSDGILVTHDWGRDLPARVETASGMTTTVFRIESRPLGILGEFVEVFVSSTDAGLPERHRFRGIEAELASARQLADRAERTARASRDEVDAIRASTSWQLTRPLRWASGLARTALVRSRHVGPGPS
jgi:hypothetical protein